MSLSTRLLERLESLETENKKNQGGARGFKKQKYEKNINI